MFKNIISDKMEILSLRRKGIKLLKVDNKILDYYRNELRDNKHKTYLEARKYLTRNYILGREIHKNGKLVIIAYGNLDITVDLNKFRVVNLENHKGQRHGWIDRVEKKKLNDLLGIGGVNNDR